MRPGVQCVTADELHVEGNHVPFERMSANDDFLAAKTAAGVFDDGKRFGQDFVQAAGEFGAIVNFGEFHLPGGRFLAEHVIGLGLEGGFDLVDFRDDGLADAAHLAFIFRADELF